MLRARPGEPGCTAITSSGNGLDPLFLTLGTGYVLSRLFRQGASAYFIIHPFSCLPSITSGERRERLKGAAISHEFLKNVFWASICKGGSTFAF